MAIHISFQHFWAVRFRLMLSLVKEYCRTLNFGHPYFWRLSQCNYFGPRNFGVFASYYTESLLYSNFRGPLFLRTCQAREIREIKSTRKKTGFTVLKIGFG